MIESRAGVEPVTVAGPQPGKTVRSVTLHALAAALMFPSPLTLFVPAAFLSSDLRNGRRGIWGSIFVAALVVFALLLGRSSPPGGTLAEVLRLVLEIGVPSVVAGLMIRRGEPLGRVILVGVGVAAIGFFATETIMRQSFSYSPYHTVANNLRTYSQQSIDAYRKVGVPEENLRVFAQVSGAIVERFIPFVLIAGSILTFVMSMVMIPRLPAGRQTGERYLFRNLAWPEWLLFAFVASGAAPLLEGPARMALLNLLAVLALLYFLQGLAIFRTLVLRMNLRILGVTIAYSLLGLLMYYAVAPFILFLAGLFDPFFDFRNLQRKGDPDESHLD